MNIENKRKTLVDISLTTWAKVRYYATIKGLSINEAVEYLLSDALINIQEVLPAAKHTRNPSRLSSALPNR
jgi:hypothetical protein